MKFFFILIVVVASFQSKAQQLYFPPNNDFNNWQTLAPSNLGYCQSNIDTLYSFLNSTNTKGFILLKDGKIVLEKYFGTFTKDSLWYWASAGKTLTAFLTGIVQEQGLLNINNTSNLYLGAGWSSLTSDKENLIKVYHHLSMSTGLNDAVADPDCTLPSCLQYLSDAGTRWAYHNAAYHKVHDILEAATAQTLNPLTRNNIWNKIGGNGTWYNHVQYSRTRDAARFGLLCLARGNWNGTTVLSDMNYLDDMINSSQTMNLSYGYLTWLNGKGSFMVPYSQMVFPFNLVPSAPSDMYCALGKNNQKIYVIPSQKIVIVRFGNEANGQAAISEFDNNLWQKINQLVCNPNGINNSIVDKKLKIISSSSEIMITAENEIDELELIDLSGKRLFMKNKINSNHYQILKSNYANSLLIIRVKTIDGAHFQVKQMF